jgi:hypothetical protein
VAFYHWPKPGLCYCGAKPIVARHVLIPDAPEGEKGYAYLFYCEEHLPSDGSKIKIRVGRHWHDTGARERARLEETKVCPGCVAEARRKADRLHFKLKHQSLLGFCLPCLSLGAQEITALLQQHNDRADKVITAIDKAKRLSLN